MISVKYKILVTSKCVLCQTVINKTVCLSLFILANREGPDEMPHIAAFHQGLHCLLIKRRDIQFYLEFVTCDSLIYAMNHPKSREKNPLVHTGSMCY